MPKCRSAQQPSPSRNGTWQETAARPRSREPPEQAPCRLACTPKERTQAMKRYIDRVCQSLEENRRVTVWQPAGGQGKKKGARRHAAAAASPGRSALQAGQEFGAGIGLGLEHPTEGGGGGVGGGVHHAARLHAEVGRLDADGHILGAEQGLQRQRICWVSRSCTWGRRAKNCTMRLILESPITLPRGCRPHGPARRW